MPNASEVDSGDLTTIRPPIVALVLLSIAFGLVLFTAVAPTAEHLADRFWTDHQKLHVFREIFMAVVFGIAGLVLVLGPLRRGVPYSLLMVAVLGFGTIGGFWAGLPVTGVGKAGIEPYLNHGLQGAALIAGCAIVLVAARRRSIN